MSDTHSRQVEAGESMTMLVARRVKQQLEGEEIEQAVGKLKKVQEKVICAMDIERISGHQDSTPLSVGLVVSQKSGIIIEEEIFIIPDQECPWKMPNPNDYTTKHIHKMYIKETSSGRKVMKLGGWKEKDTELPGVSKQCAAARILSFFEKKQVQIIVFHGDDHKAIRPFLAKFNLSITKNVSLFDTNGFFKWVQMVQGANEKEGPIKTKLELMVSGFGDRESKIRYKTSKQSALTDAFVLDRMLKSDKLGMLFSEWLDSRDFSL